MQINLYNFQLQFPIIHFSQRGKSLGFLPSKHSIINCSNWVINLVPFQRLSCRFTSFVKVRNPSYPSKVICDLQTLSFFLPIHLSSCPDQYDLINSIIKILMVRFLYVPRTTQSRFPWKLCSHRERLNFFVRSVDFKCYECSRLQ